jgi:hypothetical protein
MAAKFKRSADFYLRCDYTPGASGIPDLVGYTVTSQLLDASGYKHTLTATLNPAGTQVELTATKEDTAQWAVGAAQLDIRYTLGTSFLTDTLSFPVIPNITDL